MIFYVITLGVNFPLDTSRFAAIMPEVSLRFLFASKRLQALYSDEIGGARFPPEVVDAFFDRMAVISAATDERDLRALKSLHFEKLKGERGNRGERSIRLPHQFRLTFTIVIDDQGKYLRLLDIEDYH